MPSKIVTTANPLFGDGKATKPGQDTSFMDEVMIMEEARKFREKKDEKSFEVLIHTMREHLPQVSKVKAAKLMRVLVDMFLHMDHTDPQLQVKICQDCIQWATEEKRTFLRQSLQARLVGVHYDNQNYQEALKLIGSLLKELKKMDDKNLLVEVQLRESQTYHQLSNLPRARAALTSARTTANGIYCPPLMQAALDLQSGILHAADEKDFKTAYSYFYEAFEGLDSIDAKEKALVALKYMLLSKIMLNLPEEVPQLLSGKLALKYGDMGEDVKAMRAVAIAVQNRSLSDFQKALGDYRIQLGEDPIVKTHFGTLYDTMLQQNLARICEPYSKVELQNRGNSSTASEEAEQDSFLAEEDRLRLSQVIDVSSLHPVELDSVKFWIRLNRDAKMGLNIHQVLELSGLSHKVKEQDSDRVHMRVENGQDGKSEKDGESPRKSDPTLTTNCENGTRSKEDCSAASGTSTLKRLRVSSGVATKIVKKKRTPTKGPARRPPFAIRKDAIQVFVAPLMDDNDEKTGGSTSIVEEKMVPHDETRKPVDQSSSSITLVLTPERRWDRQRIREFLKFLANLGKKYGVVLFEPPKMSDFLMMGRSLLKFL